MAHTCQHVALRSFRHVGRGAEPLEALLLPLDQRNCSSPAGMQEKGGDPTRQLMVQC